MNDFWAKYSDSAAQESQSTSSAATSQAAWERRRQAYADLRDLIRLESAARKIRYSYHWQFPLASEAESGSGASKPLHDESPSGPTDDVAAIWESGQMMSSAYPM